MLAATLLCLVVGISDGDTLTARLGRMAARNVVAAPQQGSLQLR